MQIDAVLGETRRIVRLRKGTARVAKCSRQQNLDVWNGRRNDLEHMNQSFLVRYCDQTAAPKRPPRYPPERTLSHQTLLSRYQRTVSRRPTSNV